MDKRQKIALLLELTAQLQDGETVEMLELLCGCAVNVAVNGMKTELDGVQRVKLGQTMMDAVMDTIVHHVDTASSVYKN